MHLLQPARLLHFSGTDRASRFSRAEFPCMPGSQTSQSPVYACDFASTDIAFRKCELRRHSDFRTFRGSMAGLHVPLSTLHVQPCDCPRMTRGQVGSLLLTCATLTFATPRRFIPAHSPFVRKFSRFFHDYRYIFVTADPSRMPATSVELGERSFSVRPSESRTSEAQTANTRGLHQWLRDYSDQHGTSACSSRSRPASPCALVRLVLLGWTVTCGRRVLRMLHNPLLRW